MKLCNRLFSYKLEHDASHLTDLSLHSEPCELKQCKRNERTKLPPVATKYRCTTTSHCFNLQVQHATMPSTTGALRSSCLLTSKWDTELQAETRCHDAVEPLPFPALLHGGEALAATAAGRLMPTGGGAAAGRFSLAGLWTGLGIIFSWRATSVSLRAIIGWSLSGFILSSFIYKSFGLKSNSKVNRLILDHLSREVTGNYIPV
jgi:hypothetical protein